MNTEITVQVKGVPEIILECAYNSLLSLNESKYTSFGLTSYINKNLMIASTAVIRNNMPKDKFACFIQVKKTELDVCDLVISLDMDSIKSSDKAKNIVLMADFFRVFSENYFGEYDSIYDID